MVSIVSMRRLPIFTELLKSIRLPAYLHDEYPSVTLSYAQSLDGSIAMNRGMPYHLSGSESQVLTHRLRAAHDAVLVGIDTVIADNPSLTVRLIEGESPLPIILDSHLRLPQDSKLLKNEKPPLIATTNLASREKQENLERSGAKVIRTLPDERGWVDLNSLLCQLSDLGIRNIMVEGGARVITSFLSLHLVDWIVITIAPIMLGGLHAVESPLTSSNQAVAGSNTLPEFKKIRYEHVGKDIILWSALSWAHQ
jgi:GTP cyclohydrolase II